MTSLIPTMHRETKNNPGFFLSFPLKSPFQKKKKTNRNPKELKLLLSPGFIPFSCCSFHFGNSIVMTGRESKHSIFVDFNTTIQRKLQWSEVERGREGQQVKEWCCIALP